MPETPTCGTLLCLVVRACRVSASRPTLLLAACAKETTSHLQTQSSTLLSSYLTVVSFIPTHTHLPPATMADSYYENQTHSPSPQGEQYSNDNSERIASPSGGVVSSEGYLANRDAQPTPAAVAPARKKLSSWVGFSNLPNQVHRRSVR